MYIAERFMTCKFECASRQNSPGGFSHSMGRLMCANASTNNRKGALRYRRDPLAISKLVCEIDAQRSVRSYPMAGRAFTPRSRRPCDCAAQPHTERAAR
mmetsp:Transcript_43229/g.71897  ORF Transcript_43229/g.71897 Transcript_43229/m.71897 type:complete len:99 (-) Transcript_43229:638-934(-)